jgi:hypothetical protein
MQLSAVEEREHSSYCLIRIWSSRSEITEKPWMTEIVRRPRLQKEMKRKNLSLMLSRLYVGRHSTGSF